MLTRSNKESTRFIIFNLMHLLFNDICLQSRYSGSLAGASFLPKIPGKIVNYYIFMPAME